jgi:hypothetical protein
LAQSAVQVGDTQKMLHCFNKSESCAPRARN